MEPALSESVKPTAKNVTKSPIQTSEARGQKRDCQRGKKDGFVLSRARPVLKYALEKSTASLVASGINGYGSDTNVPMALF